MGLNSPEYYFLKTFNVSFLNKSVLKANIVRVIVLQHHIALSVIFSLVNFFFFFYSKNTSFLPIVSWLAW